MTTGGAPASATCRCAVLNVMSGDAARDYAVHHLDQVRTDGQGTTYYRCEETGTAWVEERAPDTYAGEARRLRRTDRSRI